MLSSLAPRRTFAMLGVPTVEGMATGFIMFVRWFPHVVGCDNTDDHEKLVHVFPWKSCNNSGQPRTGAIVCSLVKISATTPQTIPKKVNVEVVRDKPQQWVQQSTKEQVVKATTPQVVEKPRHVPHHSKVGVVPDMAPQWVPHGTKDQIVDATTPGVVERSPELCPVAEC